MARRRSAPEEPQQRKVALAFAGPGDSTNDNTADLLDNFLGIKDEQVPDEDVLDLLLAFPITKDHASAGLKSVLKWTDDYELAYDAFTLEGEKPSRDMDDVLDVAEGVTPSKNVEHALIDWLRAKQEDGYDARLVLLWGPEDADLDRDNAEILLDRAASFNIKALDLTAGLDDLSFREDEAAPEPEPEPEKPARRSRARKSAAPAEEPKAEDIGPTPEGHETLQESIARSQADEAQALVQQHAPVPDADVSLGDMLEALILRIVDERIAAFAEGLREATAAAPEAEEAPKRGRGRPRTRSAAERAVTEYLDEDTNEWVRVGRGRPPKDAKTRKVDPDTGDVVS